MFCVDWNDNDPYEVLGKEFDDDFTRIELIFVPCNYLHTQLDYKEDTISPQCISNLEE